MYTRKNPWRLPSNKRYQTGRQKARALKFDKTMAKLDKGFELLIIELKKSMSLLNQPFDNSIAWIVDNDTAPDNRNDIIDHHADGSPITAGDVKRMNQHLTANPVR